MKVVINRCYGGFSLSPRAIKRLAELNGRECYFYDGGLRGDFRPISLEEAEATYLFFSAFDVPNINEVLPKERVGADETYKEYNELYGKHALDKERELDRSDPKLIQVIEELGSGHRTGASGACADLRIVEIPDGTDYTIEEYDGLEHIAEKHNTWS